MKTIMELIDATQWNQQTKEITTLLYINLSISSTGTKPERDHKHRSSFQITINLSCLCRKVKLQNDRYNF